MSSSYRMELDKWLSQLDVKAFSVGDIGGSQLSIKGRTKSWDVGLLTTYDLKNPHVGSPQPDKVLDLNTSTVYPLSTHDMIFCLEVFDYVYNPVKALEIINLMLIKNGTAWVTFPSQYPLHQPIEDDALRYMPGGIKKLAEDTGLKIVEMIPRMAETYAYMDFCRAERLRSAKGEDHRVMGYIVRFTK